MAQIPQFTADLEFISKLGDNPNTDNGLSSAEFKSEFDKAPVLIQQFINNYVIPTLNAYLSGGEFLALTGGTMTGAIAMGGKKITDLGTPTADSDAATKKYADDLVENALDGLDTTVADHNHDAGDINTGTLGSARLPTVPISKGGTGATNGATGLKNLLAAGYMQASSYQIVSSVSAIPSGAPVNSIFLVPME